MDGDGDAPHLADGNYGVLPVDVLRDISLCLPANHLCRLRLVCRSWRLLTSDPLFARAHSRRRPHVVALHRQRRDELHVVDLQDKVVVKRIHLPQAGGYLRAHLDLVCVVYSRAWGQGRACVINLQQGNGSAIADITVDGDCSLVATHGYVLGHVPSTGVYKMLHLYQSMAASNQSTNSKQQICRVMTLGGTTDGRRWRATPRDSRVLVARRAAVVSGTAFFLVSPYCSDMEYDSVCSFDLATEEWRPTILQGPVHHSTKYELRFMFMLVELGDCLAMVIHHNYNDLITDLWFIEDMNKSLWTKRCSVRWTDVDLGRIDYVWPLMVLDDGRIVFLAREAGIIGTYDPRTSSWVDLAKMGDHLGIDMHQGSLLCSGLRGW